MVAPQRRRVVLALVVAVTAISFAAIFFRKAAPTHPLVAAATRLTIAALLLAPVTLRSRLPRAALRSALLGGIAYAVHFGAWVTSLTLTTVAASVTLVCATPLLVAAVGFVSKRDAPSRRDVLALALAIVGVAIIAWVDGGDEHALLGDGLALLGAAAMAVYMLLARRHGPTLDTWAFSGVATAVGAVLLFAVALGLGVDIAFVSWEPFAYIALAALLPQLAGHGLITWSLRHVRPTTVAIVTLAEPAGATLLGWLWLAERPSGGVVVGGVVTMAAAALSLTARRVRSARA